MDSRTRNPTVYELLYDAQVYSDNGKGIITLNSYGLNCYESYAHKDICIIKAIGLINRQKDTDVHYFVTRDTLIHSYLVYFNIKLNGERHQISFHSFNKALERYIIKGNTHATKWDKGNSRETAKLLINNAPQKQGLG